MPKKKQQSRQLTFLDGVEDLPLFSGTPARAKATPAFAPKEVTRQESFAACRFCLDTGKVKDGFCTCEAGQIARAAAQQHGESEETK